MMKRIHVRRLGCLALFAGCAVVIVVGCSVRAPTNVKLTSPPEPSEPTETVRQQPRAQAESATDQRIHALLERAIELRRKQEYGPALQVIDQALFLDPQNFPAQIMKEMIQDSPRDGKKKAIDRQRAYLARKNGVENDGAMMPFTDLMTFPPGRSELTDRRLVYTEAKPGGSDGEAKNQPTALLAELSPGEELWVIAKPAPADQRRPAAAKDDLSPGSGALVATLPGREQTVPVPLKHTAVKDAQAVIRDESRGRVSWGNPWRPRPR